MCCQVLEHTPLSDFERAVSELWRVCASAVVLSLPDVTPFYQVKVRLPALRRVWTGTRRSVASEEQIRYTLEANGHYWEIGHPGVSHRRIAGILERIAERRCESWRVAEMPYHRFYVLQRRAS